MRKSPLYIFLSVLLSALAPALASGAEALGLMDAADTARVDTVPMQMADTTAADSAAADTQAVAAAKSRIVNSRVDLDAAVNV